MSGRKLSSASRCRSSSCLQPFFGDLRRVEILINQGASVSCAHSGIGTSTSAPAPAPAGDGKQCMFRLTAAAAALLEFDEGQFDDVYGIIKLLVRWDADCHTRVVCETHGGGEIPLDCLHGLSPLEMAQKHDSRPFREGVRWKWRQSSRIVFSEGENAAERP